MITIHLSYVRIHQRKNKIIRFPLRLELSHYKTLGVSERASQEEIKKAYRELAKKYHPDKNANNSDAEARFKEVSLAYNVLSSPERRAEYDAERLAGSWFQPFRNFEDIFQKKEKDKEEPIVHKVPLRMKDLERGSFEQSLRLKHTSACKVCKSQGYMDPKICQACRGAGFVNNHMKFGSMEINTQVNCSLCRGKGITGTLICRECHGNGKITSTKKYKIEVSIKKHD